MTELTDEAGFFRDVARSIRWLLNRAMVPEFPLAQVVAFFTAVVFMTQRITVSIFLDRFGVQPEEIGWSLQTTLVRTAPLMFVGGLAALLSWAMFWLVVGAFRQTIPTGRSRFVAPFWIFLMLYALVFPVLLAAPAGRNVARGEKAPLGLITGFPDECVRLIDDKPRSEQDLAAWILIGESGGRLVVWDIKARQTARIRSGSVDVVRIPRVECVAAGN